jgi:hypothetical protein
MDLKILLVVIIISCLILYYKRVENQLKNDPVIIRLKQKLLPIFPEISNTVVLKGTKSSTFRKYKIQLCTEDKNGNLYDDNMLTYVFLHELAHCLNDEIGHGSKFHHIFQQLLNRAEKNNLYDPSIPLVSNYCNYKKPLGYFPIF